MGPMSSLTLPQIPKPPQLQVRGEQQVLHGMSGGLSSGLPSLSHSMKAPSHIARHNPPHITPFPSMIASTNPSAKVRQGCLPLLLLFSYHSVYYYVSYWEASADRAYTSSFS